MTLEDYCKSLTKSELFDLAIRICEKVLPVWEQYSSVNDLKYTETVVGLHHEVRANLLSDSIDYCHSLYADKNFSKKLLENLLDEFSDPIVALQDFDWELPPSVVLIFYAVYNLLEGIKKVTTIDSELYHYISVNQAITAIEKSCLMTSEQIRKIIYSK